MKAPVNGATRSLAVVLTTVSNEEQAASLASALVERRLAACVNIVRGVRSIYRWKGEICKDEECLLVIKTAADRFPDLCHTIRELHPYELPEIVLLPIAGADADYAAWLDDSVA